MTQLSGLQYELAMALSSTLELVAMLDAVLVILLRRLDGRSAVVYATDGRAEPRLVSALPWSTAVAAEGPTRDPLPAQRYANTMHVTEALPDGAVRDRFRLPDFGELSFERRGEPLEADILRALTPLMQRLARAARACVDHATVRGSEARFAELVATVPEVIFDCRLDAHGELRFEYVSPRSVEVLGLDPATLVATPHALLGRLSAHDARSLANTLRVAAAEHAPFEQLARLDDGGAEPRWIQIAGNPHGDDGEHWSGLIQDVTARQRLAAARQEASRRRMSSLLGAGADAVVAADFAGRITLWNEGARRLLGYSSDDAVGQPLTLLIPERLREAHSLGMAHHMATGETRVLGRAVELPALHAEGHEVSVELLVSRVEDQGEVFFVAMLRDLTERRRAEEEQGRSVEEQRRFANALLDLGRASLADPATLQQHVTAIVAAALHVERVSIWSFDPASITCVDMFEAEHGRHSAGMVLEEHLYPQYFAALRDEPSIIAHDALTHHATACFADNYLKSTGVASMLDIPLRVIDGTLGVLCVESTERRSWRDVDVRFCIEVAGLLSLALERVSRVRLEARHAVILSSIGDAVIACDNDRRVTLLNPVAEQLTGWCSADAIGRPLDEILRVVSTDTPEAAATPLDVLLHSDKHPVWTGSARLIGRLGEHVPIAGNASRIMEHGRGTGAVITFRDIREEEEFRRTLEQQNLRLRSIREAIPDMLFSVSVEGRIRYEKLVASPDLLVALDENPLHTVGSLFPTETAEQILQAVAETVRSGEVQRVEYSIVDATGHTMLCEARLARMSEDEATVIVRNVTEERSREQVLLRERERLAAVLSSTSAILYSARLPDFTIEYVSDSAAAVLGFAPEAFLEPGFWSRAVHPDDLDRILTGLHRFFETGHHVHEYRHLHADGTYRWLRDEVRMVTDDDGGSARAIGASFDITERRISESRLQALLSVQEIVSRLSAAFLKSQSGFADEVLAEALAGLGQQTRAERAYVFQTDGTTLNNTHEWCREGITPQREMLQGLPAGDFAFFLEPIKHGNPLYICSVAGLPPEAAAQRELLSSQGIESLLAVPLIIEGTLRGFVGIDNPELSPLDPNEFAGLMQVLADTLAAGIQRIGNERMLQLLNKRLTRTMEQQRALLHLSADVARAKTRTELFATLRDRIRPVLGVDRVSLMETIVEGQRYRFHLLDFDPEGAPETRSDYLSPQRLQIDVEGDMQGRAPMLAMQRNTAITTREYQVTDFPDWVHFYEQQGYNQFAALPLVGPAGVFGTLNVSLTRPEPLSADDVDWMAQFGSMLAAHLSIHEARLALEGVNVALEERVAVRARELRASEERFQTLFQQAPQAMLIVDSKGMVVQWNHRAQGLFSVDEADFTGTPVSDLVPSTQRKHHNELMGGFWRDEGRTMSSQRDVRALRRDGTEFSAEVSLVVIDLKGEQHVLVGIADVTDRLEAQDAVRRSLSEKETLLREIHHRVKNNLQIISSLLMLQSDQMPSEAARKLLEESVFRVRSMALIHQQLYGVESLERIDFGDYAPTLAQSLRGSLAPNARLRVDVDRLEIAVETALPLGLILNELLTNAFKYGLYEPKTGDAHTARRTGEHYHVIIEVVVVDENIRMTVADAGNGLPEGFDLKRLSSLGLKLVQTLSDQLRGRLEYDFDRGSRFVVTCPLPSRSR